MHSISPPLDLLRLVNIYFVLGDKVNMRGTLTSFDLLVMHCLIISDHSYLTLLMCGTGAWLDQELLGNTFIASAFAQCLCGFSKWLSVNKRNPPSSIFHCPWAVNFHALTLGLLRLTLSAYPLYCFPWDFRGLGFSVGFWNNIYFEIHLHLRTE